MRRLWCVSAVSAILAVIAFTGCGAETDPATDVTQTTANLRGKVQCSAGETGYWYFRWHATADAYTMVGDWQRGPVRNFNCDDILKQLGKTADGTTGQVPVVQAATVAPTNLYHTIYQICGRWYQGPENEVCLSENGEVNADYDVRPPFSGATSQYDGVGAVYNPATDTYLQEPDTNSTTDQGQGVTYAGAGTNKWCGPYSVQKGAFTQWKIWKGSMFGTWCWGTGKLRNVYFEVPGINARCDTTFYGELTGWECDGVEGSSGPTVTNGKVSFMRNVGAHQCTPPRAVLQWPLNQICGLRQDWNLKLKFTGWVDSNNIARWRFSFTCVNFTGTNCQR